MNKEKLRKIAAVVLGTSMTAGIALAMDGCSEQQLETQEGIYANQLLKELAFKTELNFATSNMTDIDYNQTIRNGVHVIGLTLDGFYIPFRYIEDYDVKSEFVVDEAFYNEFKTSNKSDINILYEVLSSLIENYTPSKIEVNDKIVYEGNKPMKSLMSDLVL